MKILEWNIHKITRDIPVKQFVIQRILNQRADVICLVEYRTDIGLINALKSEYWLEESVVDSGNQVLIAVKKDVAPEGIQAIRNTDEKACYNFLHVRFTDNESRSLSIMGIRMLSPMNAPWNIHINRHCKLMESYYSISRGKQPVEIVMKGLQLEEEAFGEPLKETIVPMFGNARNQGFEVWERRRKDENNNEQRNRILE